MRFWGWLLAVGALCNVATSQKAWAQEKADEAVAAAVDTEEGDVVAPGAAPARPAAAVDAGEDQLAVFRLQRGFYASSDLGMFFTFGGVNGVSNVQPYLSMVLGFDVNNFLGVQLILSHGYSAGNPLSQNEAPGAGGQETENYGLMNVGAQLVGAIRPTPRIAIEPKLGGGLTSIYPQLTDPNDPTKVIAAAVPHVSYGADIKYLTLLTDFTAGVSLTGYYIIGPNIPALGAALVVRYTF